MLDNIIAFFVKYTILGVLSLIVLSIVYFFAASVIKTILLVCLIIGILIVCKPITTYFITLFYNNK